MQHLMFFEAEAVAAEAAKCEAQRTAEQHERDAKAAAKVLQQFQRDLRKAEKQSKTEIGAAAPRRRAPTSRRTNTPNAESVGIVAARKTATPAVTGTTATSAARS